VTLVRLKPGHVQPVWAGHPWVFAQAIAKVDGAPLAGDEVVVTDPEGKFLGRGFFSPNSAFPVRIVTHDDVGPLDTKLLGRLVDEAVSLRRDVLDLPNADSTGYRLINSEGDSLPGLTVDVFGDVVRMQVATAGMRRRIDDLVGHIARVTHATTILDVPVDRQKEEGFVSEGGILRGPKVDSLRFRDRGLELVIPAEMTQKTGFYFDQRDNRAWVEAHSRGRRVLDAFSYIGAMGFGAARGGAVSVLSIDSSTSAITVGAQHALRFGTDARHGFLREDVKRSLERLRAEKERFDLVVLDPPKLAKSVRDIDNARRAYRRLNANGAALVEPGGLLVTCSCSGAMKIDDFLRTVALGAADVGRELTLLRVGEQAADHPVPAVFENGRYLKVACFRVRG
jgi:23S rRNA (cytosine1962-C5)-methyltransferase